MLYLYQKPPRFEPRRQVDNSLSIRFAGDGPWVGFGCPSWRNCTGIIDYRKHACIRRSR